MNEGDSYFKIKRFKNSSIKRLQEIPYLNKWKVAEGLEATAFYHPVSL